MDIPGRSPELGTSGRPRWGNRRLELDHSLVRIQSEVVEGGLDREDSSVLLEVG